MENTKISWATHTANLWWGCTHVHAGCDNCYAEAWANRFNSNLWGNDKPRRTIDSVWKDLKRYQQKAKEKGEIHRVFVGSMMDIFEKPMPLVNKEGKHHLHYGDGSVVGTEYLRNHLFNVVIPESPNLMFLLLTKRPSNINKYIPEAWKINPPENVMFGTSPVDQKTANTLIPQLLQVKGKKFLSMEPLLGPVKLTNLVNFGGGLTSFTNALTGCITELDLPALDHTFFRDKIDWVIVGGESGPHKRPFNLEWARQMRDDCLAAGVPYFFKQIDKIQPIPDDLLVRQYPEYDSLKR